MQCGVTSTPINPIERVSIEGSQGPPGQAPAVSYRLVKFDSSSGQPGDTPGRFMLSGESATASTNLFQTASLAKSKKVSLPCTLSAHLSIGNAWSGIAPKTCVVCLLDSASCCSPC